MLEGRGNDVALQRSEMGMAESKTAFEQSLRYLNDIPLTAQDIRGALDAAAGAWRQMLAGAADARHASGQETLAQASESLLDTFEQLSSRYEHSMQMLVG